MTSRIPIAGLLVLCAMLLGCPKPWTIRLCNNTSEELIVATSSGDVAWASGSSIELVARSTSRPSDFSWEVNSQGREVAVLRVIQDGHLRLYQGFAYHDLPAALVDYDGPVIRQSLQLQDDGRLYVVDPSSDLPAQVLPEQPHGFPLGPHSS